MTCGIVIWKPTDISVGISIIPNNLQSHMEWSLQHGDVIKLIFEINVSFEIKNKNYMNYQIVETWGKPGLKRAMYHVIL